MNHFNTWQRFPNVSGIFNVFTYEWIEGNPETALKEPNSMVVTRSFSERYFGSESPLGKELVRQDGRTHNVTGLIEDLPPNTNYSFSALISENSLPEDFGSWGAFHIYTYVLLQENFDYKVFETKLPELYKNHMAEIFEIMGIKRVFVILKIRFHAIVHSCKGIFIRVLEPMCIKIVFSYSVTGVIRNIHWLRFSRIK